MVALLRFVASNAWLVSLACLLGAVRYIWKAVTIHRSGAVTPYALERESAVGQVERAWAMAVILAVSSLAVWVASPFILSRTETINGGAPTLVAGILTRTPTLPPPVTPTLPPPTDTPAPEVSATAPAPVVQPLNTPEPLATPTPTLAVFANCPDPGAQLASPASGQVLSGVVEIWGVAAIPDFDFYKFEINGPLTGGEWWTVGDIMHAPVGGGVLGYWDASPVAGSAPGVYSFRLVVVDRTGNYPLPCVVQVRIAPQ